MIKQCVKVNLNLFVTTKYDFVMEIAKIFKFSPRVDNLATTGSMFLLLIIEHK